MINVLAKSDTAAKERWWLEPARPNEAITEVIRSWWDRNDTEIDLVIVNETTKCLRLGSCKRNAEALVRDLHRFDGHIQRFCEHQRRFGRWTIEKLAVSQRLSLEQRQAIASAGYIAQDLLDLCDGL